MKHNHHYKRLPEECFLMSGMSPSMETRIMKYFPWKSFWMVLPLQVSHITNKAKCISEIVEGEDTLLQLIFGSQLEWKHWLVLAENGSAVNHGPLANASVKDASECDSRKLSGKNETAQELIR
jgi:hypothetical protein